MLIVSRFHDYYDVGMKLGIDKTCVYQRDIKIIKNGFFKPCEHKVNGGWKYSVLAFCGKFYPFVYTYEVGSPIPTVIWTAEEALVTIGATRKKKWSWREYDLESEEGIKKLFSTDFQSFGEFFHTHKTPVFGFVPPVKSYRGKQSPYESLVLNPCLKDLKFFKVKDPVTAFQEISMFISGVIGVPSKPVVEVSDKVKAASRGHDGEYSFKKTPGKRGKNRWR